MMVYSTRMLILLLTVVICCSCSLAALTFELPDNERMCFYQDFNTSTDHVFEYSVIKGGQNDVDVSVESPNGKILYKETKQKSDLFRFISGHGIFTFCFSNEFSTFTHKVVYFDVHLETMDTLPVVMGDNRPTANTHMEDSMEVIHQSSLKVMDVQTEYRLNEARGRHQAEDLNHGVQIWSIGQAIVILCAGMGQVLVLKTFFTEKRELPISLAQPL